jgi:hypothetical protein
MVKGERGPTEVHCEPPFLYTSRVTVPKRTHFPDLDMSLHVTRFMIPRWLMAEIPALAKRPLEDNRRIRLSKILSWLLRHGAEKQNLPMRKDGYVCVQDLVRESSKCVIGMLLTARRHNSSVSQN